MRWSVCPHTAASHCLALFVPVACSALGLETGRDLFPEKQSYGTETIAVLKQWKDAFGISKWFFWGENRYTKHSNTTTENLAPESGGTWHNQTNCTGHVNFKFPFWGTLRCLYCSSCRVNKLKRSGAGEQTSALRPWTAERGSPVLQQELIMSKYLLPIDHGGERDSSGLCPFDTLALYHKVLPLAAPALESPKQNRIDFRAV